jgi:hypothetical protein
MSVIKFKRGLKASIPSLNIGEPAFTTDTKEFFIGSSSGNVQIGLSTTQLNLLNDYTDIRSITGEPNGFPNRNDSSISYDLNTRTVTVSGTFIYYSKGIKYSKVAVNESVQHGTGIGSYFVYYEDETLKVSVADVPWSLEIHTPVTTLYYNPTAATTDWAGPEAFLLEERHKFMEWPTHQALHFNIGSYVKGAGFALNGTYVVASGTGGIVDVSYGVDTGTFVDEDIEHSPATLNDNAGIGNQYPIFYKVGTGSEWRWFNSNIPLLKNASNNIYYNQLNGSSWQLTAMTTNSSYVNIYLCAVPYLTSSGTTNFRFIWILGQSSTNNLARAQSQDINSMNLTGLPFSEMVPLWQITMRRENAYSTATGRSRIEGVAKIIGTKITASFLSGSSTDHNNLSNRNVAGAHIGTAVSLDTTNFNGILTPTEVNSQLAFDKIDDHTHLNESNYFTSTNSGNTYSITTGRSLSSIQAGNSFKVKINADSSGAITLNVDTLGAIACKRANGSVLTEVYANGVYEFIYNGIDYRLIGEVSTDVIDCGTF